MKSLQDTIKESLRIGLNDSPETLQPKSWDELRQIINNRYKELGPGTAEEPIDFNDIDVSGMSTFYNKINYTGIFEHTYFEYIDISDWDVSNIEDMRYMFYECKYLKSIGNISKWNTSNVKYMDNMFRNCENLTFVGDLSNWDVSHVDNIGYMFTDSGITNIPNWYKG